MPVPALPEAIPAVAGQTLAQAPDEPSARPKAAAAEVPVTAAAPLPVLPVAPPPGTAYAMPVEISQEAPPAPATSAVTAAASAQAPASVELCSIVQHFKHCRVAK